MRLQEPGDGHMGDDFIKLQQSQRTYQKDPDGGVEIAGFGREKNAGDNGVENKIEDDRAFNPAGVMNQEDQGQPIHGKLDAGKMAEPFHSGRRVAPEGLEAEEEDRIVNGNPRPHEG